MPLILLLQFDGNHISLASQFLSTISLNLGFSLFFLVSISYRIKFVAQFLLAFQLFVHFAGFAFEYSSDNYVVP